MTMMTMNKMETTNRIMVIWPNTSAMETTRQRNLGSIIKTIMRMTMMRETTTRINKTHCQ